MIPESIKKHKPTCTEVRLIKGTYYVYKITSVWDPEKKRPKKKTLGCIGKITEKEGFILSKRQTAPINSPIVVKEYGCYLLFRSLNEELITNLKLSFPALYREIYSLAMLRLINKTTNATIKRYYNSSYLSEEFQDLHLSENTLTSVMKTIGESRSKMIEFMKIYIPHKKTLLFDGTCIFSESHGSSYAHEGYNPRKKNAKQINLMYVFTKEEHSPVYYRLLPGNVVDQSSFIKTIEESGIDDCIAVADKGFYSKSNTSFLDKKGISYIIPLKGNTKYIDEEFLKNPNTEKYSNCFVYHNRVIWYKKLTIGAEGKHIYIYQDDGIRKNSELQFMKRKEANYEDYTLDQFHEKQKRFGMHFLYSNLDIDAQDIYLTYKSRWEIEECFDYLKNALDLGTIYQRSNEKIEAWAFLNHISLMMFYSLYKKLLNTGLIKKYCPEEIITISRNINRIKINNEWHTTEVSKPDQKLLNTLGLFL
jgi:transposase